MDSPVKLYAAVLLSILLLCLMQGPQRAEELMTTFPALEEPAVRLEQVSQYGPAQLNKGVHDGIDLLAEHLEQLRSEPAAPAEDFTIAPTPQTAPTEPAAPTPLAAALPEESTDAPAEEPTEAQQEVAPAPESPTEAATVETAAEAPAAETEAAAPDQPSTPEEPQEAVQETEEAPAADTPAASDAEPSPEPQPAEGPEPTPAPEPQPTGTPAPPSAPEPSPAVLQAPVAPPAHAEQAPPPAGPVDCRILLVGDSMMESFGVDFYKRMKHIRGFQFILAAKFSTGLCCPRKLNWPETLATTVQTKKPDIVIFFMGANDAMPIALPGRKVVQTGSDAWDETYGGEVEKLITTARNAGALPMWIGLPLMGDKYAKALRHTSAVEEATCRRLGVPFVNIEGTLADADGNYSTYLPNAKGAMVRVRTQDREHMTTAGDMLIVDAMLPTFNELLQEHRRLHPEKCFPESEAKNKPRPQLDITMPYKPGK